MREKAGIGSRILLIGIIGIFSIQSGCSGAPRVGEQRAPEEVGEEQLPQIPEMEEAERPKRIILFIGDGMGLNAVAASSYAAGEPLAMMGMPYFGLITTHEYEFVTTDSAAGATALATGYKTHFGGISVKPGTPKELEDEPEYQLRTLIDAANQQGMRTGLISTTRINHATPGAFAAHRRDRGQYEDIALDMSLYGVDVMLGGGAKYFQERKDDRELFEEMEERGYQIATSAEEVEEAAGEAERLVGLTHRTDMPFVSVGEREMELEEMVALAIELLDRPEDDEGFFLMVEGSLIDWGGHEMDAAKVISETLDMDRALKRALEYAEERDDTLVVVTADHETGGMELLDARSAGPYLDFLGGMEGIANQTLPTGLDESVKEAISLPVLRIPLQDSRSFGPAEGQDEALVMSFGFVSAASRIYWDGKGRFSAAHTPEMVPVFAQGPGGRQITSLMDNTDLGRQLMAWIVGETFEPGYPMLPEVGEQGAEEPRNAILIVSEGAGLSALSAAYYHFGELALLSMRERAFIATHSLDGLVADRAAAATAIATGNRTRRGALGMAPATIGGELEAMPSLLALAARSGKRTGLITRDSLRNPGAAAFFVQKESGADLSPERALEEVIAMADRSQRPFGFDFLAVAQDEGGLLESSATLQEQGYSLRLKDGELEPEPPVLQLGVGELAAVIEDGLSVLSGGDEGFLLVVEAGGPGERMGALDRGSAVLRELEELDRAVASALAFAQVDGQTLVIVTSTQDHPLSVLDNHYGFHSGRCGILQECGGDVEMIWHSVAADRIYRGEGLSDAALQGEFSPPRIGFQYAWLVQAAERAGYGGGGGPAANFVPLFAHGPGARAFDGFWDQPRLGQWLKNWAMAQPARQP